MKYFLLSFIVFGLFINPSFGQTNSEIDNMRSDTIDVINYNIQLDFRNMHLQELSGNCIITFKSKMNNVSGISLDLLHFTIDEVKSNGTTLNYSYNDTLLRIQFASPLNNGEEEQVEIKYHGNPVTDPSGFGGFYFQNDYAYNMGVGFSAEPHVYGRTWHPCFDNFVERATYDIEIISPSEKKGYSNGYIVKDSTASNNDNYMVWKMEEEIPTYLACVAVAPYTHVNQTYTSNLTGNDIPVVLAAKPNDTIKLKNSFVNLFSAMDAYENYYGPYLWSKIGYTLVPFTGGAMEHATNIFYPVITANGTKQFETLMAHELSHHWWGNLVTCRTAEDMWINEGLAAYSESLFLEHQYGYKDYLQNITNTHREVLQKAHFSDGDFYPISGVPHNATYGEHTYSKGATMIHNLRTHMGDTEFFKGLKAIQDQYKFKDIDAKEFRDVLTNSTNFNANKFFDNYIFNPGFNGFEIDSFIVSPNGNDFNVELFIQQKLFKSSHFFENVPMQITFVDENRNEYSTTEILSNEFTSLQILVPFSPKFIYLNKDSGILNAVTGENITAFGLTTLQLNYTYFYISVKESSDTSFLRIEHYRISPDPIKEIPTKHEFVISPDRYWKIDGITANDFNANARITYDARDVAAGNLDNGLMIDHSGVIFHEDSLVLLWRPNQATDWSVFAPENGGYSLITNNKTDGFGRVEIENLQLGEYTLGFRKSNLSIQEEGFNYNINLYPNPVKESLKIDWELADKIQTVEIFDINGKLVEKLKTKGDSVILSTKKYKSGTFFVKFYSGNSIVAQKKFVKI